MKKIIIIALLFSGVAIAQNNVPDYIQNAPGLEAYPDQDALILRNEITISLGEDGIVTRRYFNAFKVLGDYVMQHRQCDPKIAYHDSNESLKIIQARTYMRDGSAVDVTSNALNEIVPFELEFGPDFMDFRQLIVTHLGVEHGATNVLEYEIRDRRPLNRPFWGSIDLQTDKPILFQKITIELPKGQSLFYTITGLRLEPQIEETAAGVRYTFLQENVPFENIAENPPQRQSYVDRLIYSTMESWDQVASYLKQQIESSTEDSPDMRARVETLLKEKNGTAQKISSLHRFVVDQVRTIEWPVESLDFTSRPAGSVYESVYGNQLEKAILLKSMLASAGIPASVAFVSGSHAIDESVATPLQLNDIWVRAACDEEFMWLNPAHSPDERNRYDLEAKTFFIPEADSRLRQIDVSTAEMNVTETSGKVCLTAEAERVMLKGEVTVQLTGRTNPFINPDASPDPLISDCTAQFAGAVKDESQMIGQSTRKCAFRATFKEGKIERRSGIPVRLEIPLNLKSIVQANLSLQLSSRSTPLCIHAPVTERLDLEIRLPKNMKPRLIPAPIRLKNKVGEFSQTVEHRGKKIYVKRQLTIHQQMIMPETYSDFRQLLLPLLMDQTKVILLSDRSN